MASGIPSLIASTSLFAAPVSPPTYRQMALGTLTELVEINSVEPYGSLDSVNAIAGRLRAAGFTDPELSKTAFFEGVEFTYRLRKEVASKP